jgi:transcriptional regulator with XRE-family HTH domain
MTLAELRKGCKISQATVAEALGISQIRISRLEKRKDPRLSTIQRTISAIDGHLTMIATFPDQEPVILVAFQLAEKEPDAKICFPYFNFRGATYQAPRKCRMNAQFCSICRELPNSLVG